MILHIVDVTGMVHADRSGHTCPTSTRAANRRPVTALQILVYHLPACRDCFPMLKSFTKAIGAAA